MSERPWLAVVGVFAVLCVVVTVWASIDRHPPEWDYANHLERALECHRTLANPAADRFGEIMGASAFYPPLAICTAGALYFAFPVTTLTAQAVEVTGGVNPAEEVQQRSDLGAAQVAHTWKRVLTV